MTAIPPLRPILNDTPANAIDVDWNFQAIEDYVTTEVIRRDGTVAMAAPLALLGVAPSLPSHAIPKSYADALLPVGVIWQYAGGAAPAGWAICDGTSKSTTDPAYAALFAVIGYAYGGASASFNLPDLRTRVPVGRSAGDAQLGSLGQSGGNRNAALILHGHTASASGTTNNTSNDHSHVMLHTHPATATSGSSDHAHAAAADWEFFTRKAGQGSLSVATAAGTEGWHSDPFTKIGGAHTHSVTVNDPSPTSTSGQSANHNHSFSGAVTVNTAGGGDGTNANLQPYVVVNYIIRIG